MSTSLKSALPIFVAIACIWGLAPFALSMAQTATHPAAVNFPGVKLKKAAHHSFNRTHVASTGRQCRTAKSWLIPPPPAYMPSMLPELYARRSTRAVPAPVEQADAGLGEDGDFHKNENPYRKYIHTPEGGSPQPVETRKGVATWSRT